MHRITKTALLGMLALALALALAATGCSKKTDTPATAGGTTKPSVAATAAAEAPVTPEMKEAVKTADTAEAKVEETIKADPALEGYTVQSRVVYPDKVMLYCVKDGSKDQVVFIQDPKTGKVTRQK